MPQETTISRDTIDQFTRTTFNLLPLLKKKLLRMDSVQAEHGMPMSHIQVLAMLDEGPVLSVTAISERLGIAKPNITPLIDRLIQLGYVERRRNATDRRVVDVLLLPSGRRKLEDIYESILSNVRVWMGDKLHEADFAELEKAIGTIETILSQYEAS